MPTLVSSQLCVLKNGKQGREKDNTDFAGRGDSETLENGADIHLCGLDRGQRRGKDRQAKAWCVGKTYIRRTTDKKASTCHHRSVWDQN